MFCRTRESRAAVYNIENGEPNRSAIKRNRLCHHSVCSVCSPLFVRIRLQSCEQFLQSTNIESGGRVSHVD